MVSFCLSLTSNLYVKYVASSISKPTCLILLLNMLYYYRAFIGLKNSIALNFESLVDFSALHYPDILNEIELAYFILSYKLSQRLFLKIFIKKEDLIISLNKIFYSIA
jgi:NADH:ubiquinone oxidoreductase subunit C